MDIQAYEALTVNSMRFIAIVALIGLIVIVMALAYVFGGNPESEEWMDRTDLTLDIALRVFIVLGLSALHLVVGFSPQTVLVMMMGMSAGLSISMLWNYRKEIMAFINGPESEE